MKFEILPALEEVRNRFLLVKHNSKELIDTTLRDWDDPVLCEHLVNKGNLAIATGPVDETKSLIVIDCESPDFSNYLDENLPKTFEIITPRGAQHKYYFVDNDSVASRRDIISFDGEFVGHIVGESFHKDKIDYVLTYPSRFVENKEDISKEYAHVKGYRPVDVSQKIAHITYLDLENILHTYINGIKKLLKKMNVQDLLMPDSDDLSKIRYDSHYVVRKLKEAFGIISDESKNIYIYNDGYYYPNGERYIGWILTSLFNHSEEFSKYFTSNKLKETINILINESFISREKYNNPRYIPLKNCVYDLASDKVRESSKELYLTTPLNVFYDPKAQPTKFLQFLEEVADPNDIPAIQEMFGYCLCRDYSIQKAFLFVGSGRNGKSTLLNVLIALLGRHNVSSISLHDLENNRFASYQLYGKLANIFPELPSKHLSSTTKFKALTGGDDIYFEQKGRDGFTAKNTAKLIFSTNKLPTINDVSPAFFRRWIIFKFENEFDESKADPYLLEKLTTREELSGIFNWALEGLKRLQKNKCFTNADRNIQNIMKEYFSNSDSVYSFAILRLEEKPDAVISKEDLYNEYIKFCNQNNLDAVTKVMFGNKLPLIIPAQSHMMRLQGKITRVWKNISLKDDEQGDISVNFTKLGDFGERGVDDGVS